MPLDVSALPGEPHPRAYEVSPGSEDQSADARPKRGHDAVRIGREHPSGLPDEEVLAIAKREGRILITDDRDFGELVFRRRHPHRGVIYLRLASYSFALTTARLEYVLTNYADRLDRFLVVTPASVRVRRG
jgi:predicted nuclease of predicted toxin-antitoxin system